MLQIRRFRLTKLSFLVHSTTCNAPYIQPSHDLSLELWGTFPNDFMLSLYDKNQTNVINAFNSTSRYLDDSLNIANPCFEQIVGQIYPTEFS